MQLTARSLISSIILAVLATSTVNADEVEGLITFTAGTSARASEVNDNFAAVKTAVDGTHADVAALQQAVAELHSMLAAQATQLTAIKTENAALTAEVAALKTENAAISSQLDAVLDSHIWALNPYLTVTGGARPNVRFSGVNVQIVNGEGSTDTVNGLGNLIVGYDEHNTGTNEFCSHGESSNRNACESAGFVWSNSHKSGSHYVVVGSMNSYSRYGGIVAGQENASTGAYASVTGGLRNRAAAQTAAVSGGLSNVANGPFSSISGGALNSASGLGASISGGRRNEASGPAASVSGGDDNSASAPSASISGGSFNTASSELASVSGGRSRSATDAHDWVAGSLREDE